MITMLLLGCIGLVAAVLLWGAAKRFHVEEDPRISEVEALLPGANCGGCGRSGCHDFAVACCSATTLDGLNCPSSTAATMTAIAKVVGLAAGKATRKIAVVRCQGSCGIRPHVARYDGVRSCAIEASTFGGENACAYGCLGCGDCVAACPFDALHIDEETGLPTVDWEKCVGCGKCAAVCPRSIIEIIPRREGGEYWVSCMNHDKGPVAMKECTAACIGCGKCMRVCERKAIGVTGMLAFINQEECIACGQCMVACPRLGIVHREGNRIIKNEKQ